jgi:hypothetical protein
MTLFDYRLYEGFKLRRCEHVYTGEPAKTSYAPAQRYIMKTLYYIKRDGNGNQWWRRQVFGRLRSWHVPGTMLAFIGIRNNHVLSTLLRCRAMAQAVSSRSLTAEARVRSRVHVGLVVDKVALGQIFPRVLRFSPVNFIPPVLHYTEKLHHSVAQ